MQAFIESMAGLAAFPASGFSLAAGVVLGMTGLLGVLPLRGGTGQHAGSGPGALTVWQLRDSLAAERARRSETGRAPEYLGRHRLIEVDVIRPLRFPVELAPAAIGH